MLNWRVWSAALIGGLLSSAGCGLDGDDIEDIIDELDLDDIELIIDNEVDTIQVVDPIIVAPEPDLVVIDEDVIIIDDIQSDIIIEELPDSTLLGFENFTGFDAVIGYLANGVEQSIFVLDGETVLLDYPCLDDIDLLFEDHFDVFTGDFVESFEYEGVFFLNPDDFFCGDFFLLTFDPEGIIAGVESISLIE